MLKIGVIGAGKPGKTHISLLLEIDSYELVGFYDPSKKNADYVQDTFGIKAFSSPELLLEECDVIDITEPTIAQFRFAEKAIKLSKHVFIGKPFSHSVSETKSLMRLAIEANIKIQVGQNQRFNPAFLASRTHIGDPHFIETSRLCPIDADSKQLSVVMDLMINDIDIVLNLIKSTIRKISATGVAVISESPDIVNARIEFDNGAVANLTSSRIALETSHRSKFFRRDAYISLDFLENSANIVHQNTFNKHENLSEVITEDDEYKLLNNTCLNSIEVKQTDVIKMQLESFADAIICNTRPLVPIDDGYHAMAVANKILDQLRLNTNFAAAHTIIA